MSKKDQNVVIAFFADEDAAKKAIEALKGWDKASKDIKLGAIGTLTKKGDKVKTHVGRRTGSGVSTGAILGIIAAVLSGGATLVAGAVTGGFWGGILGTFFKKSLHLTKEEIQSLDAELDAGKAAVVVTCDDFEVEGTSEQLASAGGTVKTYTVPAEAIEEASQAIEEAGED